MPDAVASRARVSDVRRFWRTVLEPPGLLRRLEPAYYVLITLVIAGPFIYGTAREALAEVATPRALETWGPSIALVGLLALVRWGAVQGPVVFSVADVAQLLGAPLRRAELVLGRLLRGMLAAAAAGAVAGALVVVGVAGHDRGVAGGRAADLIVSAALLGLLGIAGASLVQGSARWDRATRLARWPVLAAAVGLVILASSGPTGRDVAVWSGPWGWAIGPLVGRSALATVLLAAVAALAVVGALARRGVGSTERHLVRAEAREGAVAAIYSMNARYVGRSFASVGSRPAHDGRQDAADAAHPAARDRLARRRRRAQRPRPPRRGARPRDGGLRDLPRERRPPRRRRRGIARRVPRRVAPAGAPARRDRQAQPRPRAAAQAAGQGHGRARARARRGRPRRRGARRRRLRRRGRTSQPRRRPRRCSPSSPRRRSRCARR